MRVGGSVTCPRDVMHGFMAGRSASEYGAAPEGRTPTATVSPWPQYCAPGTRDVPALGADVMDEGDTPPGAAFSAVASSAMVAVTLVCSEGG